MSEQYSGDEGLLDTPPDKGKGRAPSGDWTDRYSAGDFADPDEDRKATAPRATSSRPKSSRPRSLRPKPSKLTALPFRLPTPASQDTASEPFIPRRRNRRTPGADEQDQDTLQGAGLMPQAEGWLFDQEDADQLILEDIKKLNLSRPVNPDDAYFPHSELLRQRHHFIHEANPNVTGAMIRRMHREEMALIDNIKEILDRHERLCKDTLESPRTTSPVTPMRPNPPDSSPPRSENIPRHETLDTPPLPPLAGKESPGRVNVAPIMETQTPRTSQINTPVAASRLTALQRLKGTNTLPRVPEGDEDIDQPERGVEGTG